MTAVATSEPAAKFMQCLEVWGGNHKVDTRATLPGMDAWIYSEPWQSQTSGGDVHYLSSCASGRVTRMLVADVAGHGTAVAETALTLRTLMRRFVNHHRQSKFVAALNEEFTAAATKGIFATAVAMTFDSITNKLLVCNIGHPAPLWYHAAEKSWGTIDSPKSAGNVPLGIVDGVEFVEFAVDLGTGDLVFSFTDSLVEARDGKGEMIEAAGLLALVRSLGEPDPVTLVSRVLSAMDARGEGTSHRDDVTCLLLQPNGSRPKIPFMDWIWAPIKTGLDWYGKRFDWKRPMMQRRESR